MKQITLRKVLRRRRRVIVTYVDVEAFETRPIPEFPPRKDHSWYRDIVNQVVSYPAKAVFLPHKEINTGYFTDNIRRRARIMGYRVNVLCNADGWYVWKL